MQNYSAVSFPAFQRALRNILSISQANPAVIVTTFDGINPGDHQYSSGLIVRVLVPAGFGMQIPSGINDTYEITVLSSSSFSIPLNTTNFDAFVIPAVNPGHFYTPAQVVPVGENNDLLSQSTQNVLPYP